MKRNNHAACFFSGMFLANSVPHFIHGISGDPFPTPFAEPPGKGLSSPTVNVAWAFANIIAGYNLYRVGNVRRGGESGRVAFLAGAAAISVMLSSFFTRKQSTPRLREAA
jgi:hypothetical protein